MNLVFNENCHDKKCRLVWKIRLTLILCTFLILDTSIDSKNIDFLLLDCQVYVLDIGDLPRLLTEYSIRKYYKYSQEKRDNTADAVKLINCFTEKSVLQRIFLKKGLENDVNLLFSHSFKKVIKPTNVICSLVKSLLVIPLVFVSTPWFQTFERAALGRAGSQQ